MGNEQVEIFIATYGNESQAGEALKDFRAMDLEGSINLIDAVVVVHDAEGKVHFKETADPSGKKMAKRGAIAGGLVGLIFPPAIIAIAEDRVVQRLEAGIKGYEKISKHALNADASALIVAEAEDDTSS